MAASPWERISVPYEDDPRDSERRAKEEEQRFSVGIIETAEGRSMDILELASYVYGTFYQHFGVKEIVRRLHRLVDGGSLPNIKHGALFKRKRHRGYRYFTTQNQTGVLWLPRSRKNFESTPAKSDFNFLQGLETLGALAFSDSGLSGDDYHSWRMVPHNNDGPFPFLTDPIREWPSDVAVLGQALNEVWLPNFGPVGWYWLLPVLFLLVTAPPAVATPSPSSSGADGAVGGGRLVPLSEGAPRERDPHIWFCPAGQWTAYAPVLFYTLTLLCSLNKLDDNGNARAYRMHDGDWHGWTNADTDRDLYVLINDGVPLSIALANVTGEKDRSDGNGVSSPYLFVHRLCSLTQSGGGTMMMKALQRRCREWKWMQIRLYATRSSEAFYARFGFRKDSRAAENDSDTAMVWKLSASGSGRPNGKRKTPPPPQFSRSKRSRVSDHVPGWYRTPRTAYHDNLTTRTNGQLQALGDDGIVGFRT